MEARMTDLTPSQVIRNGIVELEKRGWCQGATTNRDGQVCLQGSLVAAVGGTFVRLEAIDGWERWTYLINGDQAAAILEARAALDIATGRHGTGGVPKEWLTATAPVSIPAPQFNDLETTTQEDVILLMKDVAEDLESRGR